MAEVDWRDGKITDEGIDQIRAAIGVRKPIPAWNRLVTPEGIEHFALGVGDDNPLWWDDSYAAKSRWGGRVAPGCYLYSHMRGPRLRPEHGNQSVDIFLPGTLGIWAGERWRWHRPARAGETVRAEAEMVEVNVHEGSFGGRSVSHVERQYLLNEHDEPIAEVDHIIRRFERGQARSRGAYLDRPLATYTEEDRGRFDAQYAREVDARRGATPLHLEDVKLGDRMGPMLKGPLTVTNLVGFLLGGGSGLNPTNRMSYSFMKLHPGARMIHPQTGIADTIEAAHWEPAFAQASGMPTAYDFGFQRISWVAHLISDWAGDDGFLKTLDVKLVKPNLLGDVTWLNGKVTAIDLGEGVATVTVETTNQLEEITTRATATIELPRKRQ
jgi:acyl dehydratase